MNKVLTNENIYENMEQLLIKEYIINLEKDKINKGLMNLISIIKIKYKINDINR